MFVLGKETHALKLTPLFNYYSFKLQFIMLPACFFNVQHASMCTNQPACSLPCQCSTHLGHINNWLDLCQSPSHHAAHYLIHLLTSPSRPLTGRLGGRRSTCGHRQSFKIAYITNKANEKCQAGQNANSLSR